MKKDNNIKPKRAIIPEHIHFTENPDPVKFLEYYLKKSQFLKTIDIIRKGIFSEKQLRKLSDEEKEILINQKNYSNNWNNLLVCKNFIPDNIINNQFLGKAIIGRQDGTIEIDELKYDCGIINSTLYNVQISSNTLVKNVHTLSYVALRSGAAIMNCNIISHGNDHHFGIGREMALAIESGGRELKIFPEINIDVARILCGERGNKELLRKYSGLIKQYVKLAESRWSILEENAVISNTSKVINFFLGQHGRIDNACAVENAVILSDMDEPVHISDGAVVKDSMIQWGTHITTGAIAEKAIFTEHSGAERNAKVLDSLIGANSHVSEGEVSSSLLGSFVGFHHHALLIAAFWPEGKGNIAYGANVGSNHTSKKNDQEIWPGEGTFFGLACAVKFPSNFTQAPYSIIATAVTTLAQKITFPFSLINFPSRSYKHISPAYNEIFPAWVLSDNSYMLMRNEAKYRKRNKAKRIYIKFDIFRPSIIEKMIRARDALKVSRKNEVYTDKEIEGLGKNYMKEDVRIKAIKTYSYYIKYFCLDTLFKVVLNNNKRSVNLEPFLKKDHNDKYWKFARVIFVNEIRGDNLQELAEELIKMKYEIADTVFKSKQRDDIRGANVIDDYYDAHIDADHDEFILDLRKKADEFEKQVRKYFRRK